MPDATELPTGSTQPGRAKQNQKHKKHRKQKYKHNTAFFFSSVSQTQNSKLNTMTPKPLFFFFSTLALFILLIPISAQISDPNPKPTQSLSAAHTELNNYGFPVGLLPSSVHGYSINKTSGDFSVQLGGDCKITLPPDNYLATYSKTVRGKIVSGKIAELDGIRVRALFKWWSITGIRSTGEDLVFEVGMVTAKYPSKNFDESPDCEGKHSSS